MSEEPNARRRPSRRAVLSGLGVAGVASTAGCFTTLPAFGQRVRFGDVEEPKARSPVYRDWIPDELGASDPPGSARLAFHRPGERGEETLGAPYGDGWIKSGLDYVGVDFRSFEYVVAVGRTIVGRTPVNHARVEETMANTGYERRGDYRGFDLYRRRESAVAREATVAFGDDLVLFARSDPAAVEDVIDTGAGRRTRRNETTAAFARLVDELGALPVTTFSRGRSGDGDGPILARGSGFAFDSSYGYSVRKRLYAPEADVSRSEIEGAIEESPRALDATRVDIRVDEPTVTVVVQFDHETFADLYGPLFEYPLISWGFDYDGTELRLTHQAGDIVDASLFALKHAKSDVPADVQFVDYYETVGPGDTLAVDVSRRDEWHFRLDGTVPGTDETWTEFNVGDARFER